MPATYKGTCHLSDFQHSSLGAGLMDGHGTRERLINGLKAGTYKCEIKLTAAGYQQAAIKEIGFTVQVPTTGLSEKDAYYARMRAKLRKMDATEAEALHKSFTRDVSGATPMPATQPQTTVDPNAPKVEDAPKAATAKLEAWLESPTIDLVPGEPSKIDGIHVRGWRSNTADRVEVEMEVTGNWGSLKVNLNIVAAPGPTSADPSNMTTNDYYFSQMWSAKIGARPGTFRVPIIVKQKHAESAAVFLIVRIMPRISIAP